MEDLFSNVLKGAIESSDASSINLDNIGGLIREAICEEVKLVKLDEKTQKAKEKRKEKRKKKKDKKQDQLRQKAKKCHTITRSQIPGLIEKIRLTHHERFFLNEKFGVNRCSKCEKLKELECFYRRTNAPERESKYNKMCIACFNNIYNSQPMIQAYKEILRGTKQGAESRGLVFELTLEHLQELYRRQKGKCNYTGRPIIVQIKREREKRYGKNKFSTRAYHNLNRASVDRIDPNKGYTIDNVHLVSIHINYAKLDLLHEDFIQMCRDVVDVENQRGSLIHAPLMDQSGVYGAPSEPLLLHQYSLVGLDEEHHNNTGDNVDSVRAYLCESTGEPHGDLQENEPFLKE